MKSIWRSRFQYKNVRNLEISANKQRFRIRDFSVR